MKNESNLNRRQFINISSKLIITLPIVCTFGCESKDGELNPEESLKKLILLLGPWKEDEKQKAEDFAERFVTAKHLSNIYLTESGKIVQSLTGRFSAETMAAKEIDLQALPVEEKDLLIKLTKELYSLVEVRFDVAKEPAWGQCLGNPLWHTKSPV